MAKMHELLAAEPNITAQYSAMREETLKVFGRSEAFLRSVTSKTHFDDENSKLDTVETKDNTTTVMERLKFLLEGAFVKHVDLQYQKDATNQRAVADLVVSGKTIASGVPATTLLQLEKELSALRQVVLAAPTLQAGPVWIRDEGVGLFVTQEPQVTFSTKKTIRPIILVEATDKHPAQVDKISEDVPIAKIEKKVWSGMLTSVEKADILKRVDALLVAAKKARQRANTVEAAKERMGRSIVDFILSGSLTDSED